jgi:hypothetical protein
MAGNNLCSVANASRAVFVLGTNTGVSPVRVNSGDMSAGGTVRVGCTVRGGFDVSLNASVGGAQGGALQVTGHVDPISGGQGILGLLTSQGGAYRESDCTIVFTYSGGAVPDPQPIAPGRIWAHLSCPKMLSQDGHIVRLSDGTSVTETCGGEVDFVFENCS